MYREKWMAVTPWLVGLVRQSLSGLEDVSTGIVVAVSGGADSVALLRALEAARDPHAPFPLVIAHLNHQLRGSESDADEDFVVDLHARRLAAGSVALLLCRARRDVAAQARKESGNLEATAREERYNWLTEVA